MQPRTREGTFRFETLDMRFERGIFIICLWVYKSCYTELHGVKRSYTEYQFAISQRKKSIKKFIVILNKTTLASRLPLRWVVEIVCWGYRTTITLLLFTPIPGHVTFNK
jgi:hypothetical protein